MKLLPFAFPLREPAELQRENLLSPRFFGLQTLQFAAQGIEGSDLVGFALIIFLLTVLDTLTSSTFCSSFQGPKSVSWEV